MVGHQQLAVKCQLEIGYSNGVIQVTAYVFSVWAALRTGNHLFFECPFTRRIWEGVMGLCLISDAIYNWDQLDN